MKVAEGSGDRVDGQIELSYGTREPGAPGHTTARGIW